MKKIISICIFVLFLLAIPFTFASIQSDIDGNVTLYACGVRNATYDGSKFNTTNGTVSGDVTFNNDAGCRFDGSTAQPVDRVNFSATATTADEWLNTTQNMTVAWWYCGPKVMRDLGMFFAKQDANFFPCPGGFATRVRTLPVNKWQATYCLNAGEGNLQVDVTDLTHWFDNDNCVLMAVDVNRTDTQLELVMYVNGTGLYGTSGVEVARGIGTLGDASHTTGGTRRALIGGYTDATGTLQGNVSHLIVINRTKGSNLTQLLNFMFNNGVRRNLTTYTQGGGAEPDTTPPHITYYNVTNENGCENWNTNKSNPCSTSSVVPTIQFTTNEAAFCAIAGNSSESLGRNYTETGASRNCTGAMAGEGGTNHRCTLTSQDELVYDTSYVYISCKDEAGNQNTTGKSTSGALKLSITSLESNAKSSIGIGIQNALLSSYTNYTDLQIYARNLSNDQVKGTFDRAAKKGSKMWAFNRIGVSDSHVNMFNLTPVLYTLEFVNITSTNITNQTQKLIEATK